MSAGLEKRSVSRNDFVNTLTSDRDAARRRLDQTKQKKLRQLREAFDECILQHQQPEEAARRQPGSEHGNPAQGGNKLLSTYLEQGQLRQKLQHTGQHSPHLSREQRTGQPEAHAGASAGAHDADAGTKTSTGANVAGPRQDRRPNDGQSVEVTNMSKRNLSADELSLLSKGLNFVPTAKQSVTKTIAELKEWERLVRLREYWHGRERATTDTETNEDDKYKESKWTPAKGRDPCLDLYLEEVTREIPRRSCHRVGRNLSKGEEEALSDLIDDKSIIIRPAD